MKIESSEKGRKAVKYKIENLIVVRGGGDIATGTIYKLRQCGYPVLILETAHPSAIRRNVAFSEAVYEGQKKVEEDTAYLAENLPEAVSMIGMGKLPVLIDEKAYCLEEIQPLALVDAILAKRNLGTIREMCPITVALGPGFEAGRDVDAVVETKRGHNLGRVYYSGCAAENTGVPGVIAGYGRERVIHSPAAGVVRCAANLADSVEKDQVIAQIETPEGLIPVQASLTGLLRGLIRDGYPVTKGFKIADIDPRAEEYANCFTISDKARCIAGGVVEAIEHLKGKPL